MFVRYGIIQSAAERLTSASKYNATVSLYRMRLMFCTCSNQCSCHVDGGAGCDGVPVGVGDGVGVAAAVVGVGVGVWVGATVGVPPDGVYRLTSVRLFHMLVELPCPRYRM